MEKLKAPSSMQFGAANVAERWRRWEQHFQIYYAAAELDKKAPKTQVAILLNVAGPETFDVYNTFVFDIPEDREPREPSVEEVLMAFRAYCQPRKNTVFERYHFWSRRQQKAETIDQWVMDLRTLANNCEFGDQRKLIIRDMLVFGIRDDRTKERLLREAKLTLQAALDICRAAEPSQLQVQAMAKDPPQIEVHVIKAREQKGRATSHGEVRRQTEKHTSKCRYCGLAHAPRQ